MRILCTNDDGIHSPGIAINEQIARQLSDDVWIVAPELDQSGVSHSLSLNDPLRLREIDDRHFAVRGTPTDCVIMGSRHVMPHWPDLVISGVNRGRNVAEDVVYSGTIAGALEGTILGLPSFALSQAFEGGENRERPPWDVALKFGADIIRKVMKLGVPRDTVININFPPCAPDEVRGIAVARQGKRNQGFLRIDGRQDGRGNPYYWIGFQAFEKIDPPAEGTDLFALDAHYVTVTPLRLDRTDVAFSEELKTLF
ncbi:5'/3'-nucleotidase SurE [[Pseudomonas] carboxydohydrogena]|uniref:5'-nucleotidase SurE n=1 Tax=Afipia carboxydohydrogena TaxID=290 RepID=A0ABY8BJF2_AFICR|nr:5'/3'-nucleotidase SurE [[Pseudomonas] carboxydohydrogena]WEF50120.1 5'/3'-nucleotidase SurE [[Pseudomonas] carboxydohydrogena]